LRRTPECHRSLERAHRNLRAAGTDFGIQLGTPTESSGDWATTRKFVDDLARDGHHCDVGVHLIGNPDVDAPTVCIEVERATAVEHSTECDVAGDCLELGALEVPAVDFDRAANGRQRRIGAASSQGDYAARALCAQPGRRSDYVNVAIDRFGIELTWISIHIDGSAHDI